MTPLVLLIDPKAPPEDSLLLYTASDNWYGNKTHRLYILPGFLVIHISRLKTNPFDQLELPLEALSWLVDSIEYKFWKTPSEGGLPRDIAHVEAVIAGENIRLGRSNNAGAEDVPGFTLRNLSRITCICTSGQKLDFSTAQIEVIPDFIMKEGGLFTLLKSISERYQRGEFGPISKS